MTYIRENVPNYLLQCVLCTVTISAQPTTLEILLKFRPFYGCTKNKYKKHKIRKTAVILAD